MKYQNRIVDSEIEKRLSSIGGIVIEGPKACGKTTTAEQFAASKVFLDVDDNARETIKVDPNLVLSGDTPRLIDEWQIEPKIWNYIRRTIDKRSLPGQFILTGSAIPSDEITRHTGAGRIARIKLRPMTLFESKHSNGKISLKKLMAGKSQKCTDPGLSVKKLAKLVSVGGWPMNMGLSEEKAIQGVRDYLEETKRTDINRVDGTKRNPEKVGALIQSLSRNISTTASVPTLAADTRGSAGNIHEDTIREYLTALSRLMIYEKQPAWAPHLRSKYRLRKSPKHHFVDPSLAVAALRATPEKILKDMKYFGFLFESLVIRELRVFSQLMDANVFHYRDESGLEVDAIVEVPDGRWGAFEIKLGQGSVEDAAESLLDFKKKIDTSKSGEPAILGIIVGDGYGYTRGDGIEVTPIGSLGP